MSRFSQRASGLRLNIIGKRCISKPSKLNDRDKSLFHQLSLFQGEVLPTEQKIENQNFQHNKEQKRYSFLQDSRISNFSHSKILLVQKNLLILTMVILFLGMVKVEIDSVEGQQGVISQRMLLVIDLITCMLVLLVICRKFLFLELMCDQRKVYVQKKQRNQKASILRILSRNQIMIWQLLLQIILVTPHPTTLLIGSTYSYMDNNQDCQIIFSYNDLLSVLMLIKVYIVIRAIVALTIFSTPRATRICNHNEIDHSFLFSIKCMQKYYPLRCTIFIFIICMVSFGYGFRVTEGRVSTYNDMPLNGFEVISNCYWWTLITMTTIGYGDYKLTTIHARALAIILAILGVVLSSQLVVALSDYLTMKANEARSHTTLFRLQQHKNLQIKAKIAFAKSIKIANKINQDTMDPLSSRRLQPIFVQLKNQIDLSKMQLKRIKAILPTQNMSEEMIRSFEMVKDSFRCMYNQQNKVKRKIQEIEASKDFKQQQVCKQFVNEVNNIMSNFQCNLVSKRR